LEFVLVATIKVHDESAKEEAIVDTPMQEKKITL